MEKYICHFDSYPRKRLGTYSPSRPTRTDTCVENVVYFSWKSFPVSNIQKFPLVPLWRGQSTPAMNEPAASVLSSRRCAWAETCEIEFLPWWLCFNLEKTWSSGLNQSKIVWIGLSSTCFQIFEDAVFFYATLEFTSVLTGNRQNSPLLQWI